jgi:hypothetical protein
MTGRDVLYNTALDDFSGQLAVGPVRDGPARIFRFFTGQGLDPADLLSTDPGWCTWPRQVLQAVFDA